MAFAWLVSTSAPRSRRGARVAVAVAAAALAGVALIFTKHGLAAFGAYEN